MRGCFLLAHWVVGCLLSAQGVVVQKGTAIEFQAFLERRLLAFDYQKHSWSQLDLPPLPLNATEEADQENQRCFWDGGYFYRFSMDPEALHGLRYELLPIGPDRKLAWFRRELAAIPQGYVPLAVAEDMLLAAERTSLRNGAKRTPVCKVWLVDLAENRSTLLDTIEETQGPCRFQAVQDRGDTYLIANWGGVFRWSRSRRSLDPIVEDWRAVLARPHLPVVPKDMDWLIQPDLAHRVRAGRYEPPEFVGTPSVDQEGRLLFMVHLRLRQDQAKAEAQFTAFPEERKELFRKHKAYPLPDPIPWGIPDHTVIRVDPLLKKAEERPREAFSHLLEEHPSGATTSVRGLPAWTLFFEDAEGKVQPFGRPWKAARAGPENQPPSLVPQAQ